ncbi:OsmC family peroxiredoxin [Alkalibaculum sp. M08DMB]|uniref:OsmC family peroxiredoxin n=2 Tax=Alkalibaculum sporogenes TaxID=2655001 RepID=A0A6A7K4S6_9FIRM|nr:OsmC family peroxiredoxin [Alkalibaculum sporogenes]
MTDLKFKVIAKSENRTKTIVQTNGFTMTIDEPKNLGGTNEGANPVEYLLGALSGCLNVVSHIVAKELGFELNGLEIELEGNLNPAKFMGKSDNERSGFKEITVNIKPDSNADKATLEKWIEIVESRCPVSDNIANYTPVKLVLV